MSDDTIVCVCDNCGRQLFRFEIADEKHCCAGVRKIRSEDKLKAVVKEFIYELQHDIGWFEKWNKSAMNTKEGKLHDISCIQAIGDCLRKFHDILAKHGIKIDD